MKRGEIWTVAGGPDYASKPRPVVIVQDDRFDTGDSITICPCTADATPGSLARIAVEPSETSGLRLPSWLMVDKLTTVPRDKLGRRAGRLDDETMQRLSHAIVVFLGLAS